MTVKIKWRVQPNPTGPYASFQRRGWPIAHWDGPNEKPAAMLMCEDDYVPAQVKRGDHKPIFVCVADHSDRGPDKAPWRWLKLKTSYQLIDDAKAAAQSALERYIQFHPKEK